MQSAWGRQTERSQDDIRDDRRMTDAISGADRVDDEHSRRTPPPSMITRDSYRQIDLYAPDRSACATDISDNTNLWGVPPHAAQALRDADAATVSRYPSLYAAALKTALAEQAGVTADMVVTGCGSDDVLDSAIRAFTDPGERIAVPDPSFAMIPIFARMNGLEPVPVALQGGTALDADAMLATAARVIYLCSPNNPTGNCLDADEMAHVAREAPGVVIIDEAYVDFADGDARDLLNSSDRLLICRTMSKAYGLAGLRVGYALGAPALVAEVEKSRGPYKVNALAERAALAALREDGAWVRKHVAEAVANRERLGDELRARALKPLPSAANFLLVPVPDAAGMASRLRARGVAVRPFVDLPSIGDALRISVGPWVMMQRFLDAFDEALSEVTCA